MGMDWLMSLGEWVGFVLVVNELGVGWVVIIVGLFGNVIVGEYLIIEVWYFLIDMICVVFD